MAAVGIRLVVKIGQVLWRRHKREERRERLQRLAARFTSDIGKDMQKLGKKVERGETLRPTIRWKYDEQWGSVRREMHRAVEESLDALGDTAVRSAKRRAPRDTGELRASIDRTPVQRGKRGPEVIIYADAAHARFVEYGGAHSAAQPFLRPAARASGKRIAREVKKRAPKR